MKDLWKPIPFLTPTDPNNELRKEMKLYPVIVGSEDFTLGISVIDRPLVEWKCLTSEQASHEQITHPSLF